MVKRSEAKVNAFEPAAAARQSSLQARVQTLTCLLRLGRLIETEDNLAQVAAQVPEILIEGLWRNEPIGVRLSLGGRVYLSSDFQSAHCVCRKAILTTHSPVGDVELHASGPFTLTKDQEELIDAVAERLGRFHERKGLQTALERSEQRYRRLFHQARDGIVLVDAGMGVIHDANEAFVRLIGLPVDDVRGAKIWEIVPPAYREPFQADLERIASSADPGWLAVPVATVRGELLELEVTAATIQFGAVQALQLICRDVTERRTLMRRLAESEMRYRAIFDSTPVSMVLCDAGGHVLDVNACLISKFFRDQVGKEHFIGRHILDLDLIDLADLRDTFFLFLRGVCIHFEEVPIPESRFRPAGVANVRSIPLVNDAGQVEGGVVFVEDMTEMREVQRAMIQSAKMAAVGRTTLGFAHEIGTPLGIIMANAQYLLQELQGRPGREELSVILSEANRITNLIQQLLIFSRPAKFRRQTVAASDLVFEVLHLMQGQEIMRGVELEADFASDVPPLAVEPTLIKQVLFNLILNACQAMPEGGRLAVATRLVRAQPVGESRAPHVEISVTDAGVGMTDAQLRQIFTPFYTTKEVGKGTGLGLSISYRIIQNHGGTIIAESPGLGLGATFRVYLPLTGPAEVSRTVMP